MGTTISRPTIHAMVLVAMGSTSGCRSIRHRRTSRTASGRGHDQPWTRGGAWRDTRERPRATAHSDSGEPSSSTDRRSDSRARRISSRWVMPGSNRKPGMAAVASSLSVSSRRSRPVLRYQRTPGWRPSNRCNDLPPDRRDQSLHEQDQGQRSGGRLRRRPAVHPACGRILTPSLRSLLCRRSIYRSS